MPKRWPNVLQPVVDAAESLKTNFYYKKYFEWGLPTRRFVQVNIETNSVCNRTCHFCLFGIKDEVPAIRMPAELYFKIIDQLAEMGYVGRLSLFCINEPLTDKRIYDFIKYASLMLPGCYHVLVSNGDILNRERLDALFDNGLDLLLINSYDEAALERNKIVYEYALDKYPDKILHTDRTIYTDWVSRAGHIQEYAKEPVKGYCDYPNYVLYVKPDGKVLSCCHDFDDQNVMGNLTKQSIKEAWYGEQFTEFRRRLNKGDRGASPLCEQCDHKPDLEYFKWNRNLAKAHGKGVRPILETSGERDMAAAQAIRATYIERENRQRRKSRPVSEQPLKKTAVG